MTKSRIAVPRGTLAVTRRTNERKLLWTPSSSAVHEGWLYALAKAQHEEGFALHHGVLLPTHEHLAITPGWETDIGAVFRCLHRESARFVQELLLATGYDAPQAVWDKRSTHAMHLVDAGAQLEWTYYSHVNVLEAGLVSKVEDYPGWVSPLGLLKGGVVVVKRPEVHYGRGEPTERELVFSAQPELVRVFGSDLEGVVYRLRKQVEARERELRGRSVVGAARIRRIHPFSEPRTCRERRGQRIPRSKVGRGWAHEDRRELKKQLEAEDQRFLTEQAEALEEWRAGNRDVEFPYGTLQMVREHGAACAEPHPDAVLCAPDRSVSCWGDATIAELVVRASEASREELEEVEDLRDAGVERADAVEEPVAGSSPERGEVEHRELESPVRSADRPHARRLVILRNQDRRRGSREPDS